MTIFLHHLKAKLIETPDFSGKVIVIYFFGEASICTKTGFPSFWFGEFTIAASSQEFTKNQKWCSEMQELVKTGKYTEINKQSDVKFWLN